MFRIPTNPIVLSFVIVFGCGTPLVNADWYFPTADQPTKTAIGDHSLGLLFSIPPSQTPNRNEFNSELGQVAIAGLSLNETIPLEIAVAARLPLETILASQSKPNFDFAMPAPIQQVASAENHSVPMRSSSMPMMGTGRQSINEAGMIAVSYKTVAPEKFANFAMPATLDMLLARGERNLQQMESDAKRTSAANNSGGYFAPGTYLSGLIVGLIAFGLVTLRRRKS